MVEAAINLYATALFVLGLVFVVLAAFVLVTTVIIVAKKIREEVRKR